MEGGLAICVRQCVAFLLELGGGSAGLSSTDLCSYLNPAPIFNPPLRGLISSYQAFVPGRRSDLCCRAQQTLWRRPPAASPSPSPPLPHRRGPRGEGTGAVSPVACIQPPPTQRSPAQLSSRRAKITLVQGALFLFFFSSFLPPCFEEKCGGWKVVFFFLLSFTFSFSFLFFFYFFSGGLGRNGSPEACLG